MKLDKKDLHILGILDSNARIPIKKIAKQTRLNKDVVRYRIRNLEKNKIIEGYYAIINTPKLGYMTIRLYFDLVDCDANTQKELIEHLDRAFNAGQIFAIDGEYQLGILAWEKSAYDVEKKLKKLKSLFGDNINREALAIFTTLNHYPRKIFHSTQKEGVTLKEEEKTELRKNDLKILSELSKNSRISTTELSLKLKIPQRTIAYRIKELEKKGIILQYRAKINTNLLGYTNYFIEIYTHKNKEVKEIEMFARLSKNCIYSDTVFPGADIELETEFQNKTELLDFINELKDKFKAVKKIKYWSTLNYEKINYFPGEIKSQAAEPYE
jgi:Lrp/AsnC family leucine-responsive transcriptional regulator